MFSEWKKDPAEKAAEEKARGTELNKTKDKMKALKVSYSNFNNSNTKFGIKVELDLKMLYNPVLCFFSKLDLLLEGGVY